MSAAPGLLASPRAFHLLAKPTGAVCNLDCSFDVSGELIRDPETELRIHLARQ